MKQFIIDTDTASDDAVALILALREPGVRVAAISVVAGNIPVELGVKNALTAVERAATYRPPVFRGMDRPLLRPLVTATREHGEDGMSNLSLPEPKFAAEGEHAVDALARLAGTGEYELITLGPLTNAAMAFLKAPEPMQRLRRITMMAGAGFGPGNMTPVAEYNAYVDAEALSIVLQAGVPLRLVGWDASLGPAFLSEAEMNGLLESGSALADFCIRINRSLLDYNREVWGRSGIDLPDPVAVAAAVHPEIILESKPAYVSVETHSPLTYGQVVIDLDNLFDRPPNAEVVRRLDGQKFKEYLHQALA
jgi:purine nucleosidase